MQLLLLLAGAAAAVAAVAMDRFGAMLTAQYGGRKSIREVIRSGRLVQVKLGRVQRWQRAEIPQKKPRFTRARKKKARANYFGRMATILQEAGVSGASSAYVEHRRLLRIMKRRLDTFKRGSRLRCTTHLWPQHNLRRAGVPLPEVQWSDKEGIGGKESKRGKECGGGVWAASPWWSSSTGWGSSVPSWRSCRW